MIPTLVSILPEQGSLNMGDYIIGEAVRKHLYPLYPDHYVIEVSKNLPLSPYVKRVMKDAEKVLGGTNLFHFRYFPLSSLNFSWRVGLTDLPYLKGVRLFGVGSQTFKRSPLDLFKPFAKALWRYVLNERSVHIVRDERTKEILEDMGFDVENLGCPSIWDLKPVKGDKREEVITTLTDYSRNPSLDLNMLEVLSKLYERVYLWPQGRGDLEYLEALLGRLHVKVVVLRPRISDFDEKVRSSDYVGTRVHAAIRALQRGSRAFIVAVDHRGILLHEEFGIPAVSRDRLEEIPGLVNSYVEIRPKVDRGRVDRVLSRWRI